MTTEDFHEILKDNLKLCTEDIFDDRNDAIVEEASSFFQTISELMATSNSDTCNTIIESLSCLEKEKGDLLIENNLINNFVNMKNNMGENSHINNSGNNPLDDVDVFTALYHRGYIKDSYMQTHVANLNQTLRSTFSDLMGGEWVRRVLHPCTPQTSLGDWIDSDILFKWNRNLAMGNTVELPSVESILESLQFHQDKLAQSIADKTYADINVNMHMCYEISAFVAKIAELESNQTSYKIIEKMVSFGKNHGMNGFYLCGCIAVNLVCTEVVLAQTCTRGAMDTTNNLWRFIKNAEYFSGFPQIRNEIQIPNAKYFVRELVRLLAVLKSELGCKTSLDEALEAGLPVPILMDELVISSNHNFGRVKNALKINVSSLEGSTECQLSEFANGSKRLVTEGHSLDSLVERLQVESKRDDLIVTETIDPGMIHKQIMGNRNELFRNIAKCDFDASRMNLAVNSVLINVLKPIVTENASGADLSMLESDIVRMEYENKKYIGLVETYSSGLVEQLADQIKDEVLNLIKNHSSV